MSLHSRNRRGLLAVLLFTALAVLCSVGTIASAQDQPAPKWELFGGYSLILQPIFMASFPVGYCP